MQSMNLARGETWILWRPSAKNAPIYEENATNGPPGARGQTFAPRAPSRALANDPARNMTTQASLPAGVGQFRRNGPWPRLRKPQYLHGGGLRVAEEDRVDVLHDVGADVEEVPFVLDGDKGAPGAVVLRDLEWFGERA